MAKGRLQLRLTPEALASLKQCSQAAGLTRQAYIEAWLTDMWPVKVERKPALTRSVAGALPSQTERLNEATRVENLRRETADRQSDCPHPSGNRTSGKDWKCTLCGYQHVSG